MFELLRILDSTFLQSVPDATEHHDVARSDNTANYQVLDGGDNQRWLIQAAPTVLEGISLATGLLSVLARSSIFDKPPSVPAQTYAIGDAVTEPAPVPPATAPTVTEVNTAPRASESITSFQFRKVAFLACQNVLFLLRIARWKVEFTKAQRFDRSQPLPYRMNVDLSKGYRALYDLVDETFGSSADYAAEASQTKEFLGTIKDGKSDAALILSILLQVHELHRSTLKKMGAVNHAAVDLNEIVQEDQHHTFGISVKEDGVTFDWPAIYGDRFFAAVINVAHALRVEDQEPGFRDFIAFHLAYSYIFKDSSLLPEVNVAARFLGTVGFRPHSQTYVSLTDPGEGHIFGTTRHSRWMTGAIVHNEHLERPKGATRDEIESYRIPDVNDFACVRLHVGAQAPTTVFIGRFLHHGQDFKAELVASVNITKAALGQFFSLGAAECKISMDGLTTSQMLQYMSALASVPRKRLQYLSAAFNIHPTMAITDDAEAGVIRMLQDGGSDWESKADAARVICLRGIQLAAQGGFDKVTFDGASDQYPSVPFIKQIGFSRALELVHEAHSVGLTTYMSAGFTFQNIKEAVYTGVDGIGLGGAQILRYMDKETGMHGPYTEENIDRIKVEREDAEKSLRGRGALLLARLDQMHFEGSLTEHEAALREPLFGVLQTQNIAELQRILAEEIAAGTVLAIFHDDEQPYVGRARRILRHEQPRLRRGVSDDGEWIKLKQRLEKGVREKNDLSLQQEYEDVLWTKIRAAYRAAIEDDKHRNTDSTKYFQGEPRQNIKGN